MMNLLSLFFGSRGHEEKPSIVDRISTNSRLGQAIRLPLPASFAALADPGGVLQPYPPLWEIWCQCPKRNVAQVLRVVQGVAKEAQSSSETWFWKAHVSSVEYAPPHELTDALSSIADSFDTLYANPPSHLRAPFDASACRTPALLLSAPPAVGLIGDLCSDFCWIKADDLQYYMYHKLMGAANCILHNFAKSSGGEDQILAIEKHWLCREDKFPALRLSKRAGHTCGFLLVAGTMAQPRVSAVIDLQPCLSFTFIAFALQYLQELTCTTEATENTQQERDECDSRSSSASDEAGFHWQDHARARSFALKILRRFAAYAMPMLIILTTHQLIVIERVVTDDVKDIQFRIHTLVLASPGPDPSVEPVDEAAQELLSGWNFSFERNLTSSLSLLAIRASQMDHPSRRINTYDEALPMTSAEPNQADSPLSVLNNTALSQLSKPHKLLFRCTYFAYGRTSQVYHGCIISADEQHCDDLLHRPVTLPCSNPVHKQVVVKATRTERLPDKEDEIDAEEFARTLEHEATVFEALQALQGEALPIFYGRRSAAGRLRYAYEEVGTALHLHDYQQLQLTSEEDATVESQFKAILSQVHRAGYVHGDVAGRNLCVRRITDAAGHSQLQCRLVDFSEAPDISNLEAEAQTKETD